MWDPSGTCSPSDGSTRSPSRSPSGSSHRTHTANGTASTPASDADPKPPLAASLPPRTDSSRLAAFTHHRTETVHFHPYEVSHVRLDADSTSRPRIGRLCRNMMRYRVRWVGSGCGDPGQPGGAGVSLFTGILQSHLACLTDELAMPWEAGLHGRRHAVRGGARKGSV